MSKIPRRIIIYTRDVENITGRKRRAAYAILQKIKAFFGKEDPCFITISEFCCYMKIEEELVREYLVD
jgi:hypothetical protein